MGSAKRCHVRDLVRVQVRVTDFQSFPATIGKFSDQLAQLLVADVVAVWVGEDGDSTRSSNRGDCSAQLAPLGLRTELALVSEKVLEGVFLAASHSAINQKLCDVIAADRGAGKRVYITHQPGNAGLLQAHIHIHRPLSAQSLLLHQETLQAGVVTVYPYADDMDLALFPEAGDLHACNESQDIGFGERTEVIEGFGRVMVCDGKVCQLVGHCAFDQRGRSQNAIRIIGM